MIDIGWNSSQNSMTKPRNKRFPVLPTGHTMIEMWDRFLFVVRKGRGSWFWCYSDDLMKTRESRNDVFWLRGFVPWLLLSRTYIVMKDRTCRQTCGKADNPNQRLATTTRPDSSTVGRSNQDEQTNSQSFGEKTSVSQSLAGCTFARTHTKNESNHVITE